MPQKQKHSMIKLMDHAPSDRLWARCFSAGWRKILFVNLRLMERLWTTTPLDATTASLYLGDFLHPGNCVYQKTRHGRKLRFSNIYGTPYNQSTASEENYQGTILAPLFGTGQDSAASPAVWLALSVVLLNAFDKLADDGFSFRDPWNAFLAKWKVFAFVDDSYLGFVDPTNLQTIEQLTACIERSTQLWEKLLFISGGTLNLSK
jgi:hypothetical protein